MNLDPDATKVGEVYREIEEARVMDDERMEYEETLLKVQVALRQTENVIEQDEEWKKREADQRRRKEKEDEIKRKQEEEANWKRCEHKKEVCEKEHRDESVGIQQGWWLRSKIGQGEKAYDWIVEHGRTA